MVGLSLGRSRGVVAAVITSIALAACGGGGGGSAALPPGATPTPTASPTAAPTSSTSTFAVSPSSGGQTTLGPVSGALGNYTETIAFPGSTSGSATLTATLSSTLPAGAPVVSSMRRKPAAIGVQGIAPLVYITLQTSATVTFATTPTLTFVLPFTVNATLIYLAAYDPQNGWSFLQITPTVSNGNTLTFAATTFPGVGVTAGTATYFVLFTSPLTLPTATPTASPTASPTPVGTPSPSPTPSATPSADAAYLCPTSDAAPASVARAVGAGDAVRQHLARGPRWSPPSATLLAVTYDRATATRAAASIASKEAGLGATVVRTLDFAHTGRTIHILSVSAAKSATIAAALRAQAGVQSVGPTGYRHTSTVSAPYWTTDPYFAGFISAGTFHVVPYAETASVPGQWDMHAIGLGSAFAYSQPNNGSGIVNANALGSPSVKLAIIDTGEDTTHPELSSKITRQRCFITNPSNVQSTSNFTTDPQGHGTDVSGIAGAETNNGFGFTAAGGKVSIYGYRIFPTPDDTCASDANQDAQCGATTPDIASAIADAVGSGANVISMSLGGGNCVNGQDDDPVEGAAIAEAVAANVVVVAAAGNDGSSPLEAPACDPGVIAVGASSLGDGQPNGTSSVGTAGAPVDYVASYSDWGTPAVAAKSASAWGIVAPGGDPNGNTDLDDLHWIENIWTSTPFMATPTDTSFAGECTDDYPNSNGTTAPVDCRTLIAGTSMATPHVAGAAALILSVSAAYQSPTAMKTLLCTTADDIGDPHEGCGRLNVYRAMAKALADPILP